MGRRNDEAARRQVVAQNRIQYGLGRGIEGGGGLIEQPERTPRNQQTGQRHPAALPGRQVGAWQVFDMRKPETAECLAGRRRRMAAKPLGVMQVFAGRQGALDGFGMSQIVQSLGERRVRVLHIRRFETDFALHRRQKTRENAQERGFSGAIAPNHA